MLEGKEGKEKGKGKKHITETGKNGHKIGKMTIKHANKVTYRSLI